MLTRELTKPTPSRCYGVSLYQECEVQFNTAKFFENTIGVTISVTSLYLFRHHQRVSAARFTLLQSRKQRDERASEGGSARGSENESSP